MPHKNGNIGSKPITLRAVINCLQGEKVAGNVQENAIICNV